MSPILSILLLSLIASLGTGLGGFLALMRKPGKRSFGFLMGMTAGVMISLSFLELVNEAWRLSGFEITTLGFGVGALFIFLLDFYLPHIRFGEVETHVFNQQTVGNMANLLGGHRHRNFIHAPRILDRRLLKTGLLLAIGISLHNLPEGIAIGAGFMH